MPQCTYIPNEDAISLIVLILAVFITGAIESHERQDIAVVNIPGTLLHAKNDDEVIMKMQGWMSNIYHKLIPTDGKCKLILYMHLQKALYGMLKRALIFYNKLVKELGSTVLRLAPTILEKTKRLLVAPR